MANIVLDLQKLKGTAPISNLAKAMLPINKEHMNEAT
jgi:hypothetical protein